MARKAKSGDTPQATEEEEKKTKQVAWRNPNKTQADFIEGYAHHGDIERALKAVGSTRKDFENWKEIPYLNIVKRMDKARAEKQTEYIRRLESMSKGEGKQTDKSFQACKEWLRANNKEYKEKDESKGFHGTMGVIAIPMEIDIEKLGLKIIDAETVDMTEIKPKKEPKVIDVKPE